MPKPEEEAQAPGMAWREAAAGDVRIRYVVSGSGPPLLLLHGLSCSVHWWERNIGALSKDFEVYAVDLVHFGGELPQPRFVLEHAARRLAAWMASAGIGSAFVVGHSMGGRIAAQLAFEFPSVVRRLVLVDPAVLFAKVGPKITPVMLLRAARHDLPPGLLARLVGNALRAGPRMIWSTVRTLLGRDFRSHLPGVRTPTLLIWGGRDGIVPATFAEEVCALLPHCERRIFAKAGHNPMWDCPEEFNAAVRAYLLEPAHNGAPATREPGPPPE